MNSKDCREWLGDKPSCQKEQRPTEQPGRNQVPMRCLGMAHVTSLEGVLSSLLELSVGFSLVPSFGELSPLLRWVLVTQLSASHFCTYKWPLTHILLTDPIKLTGQQVELRWRLYFDLSSAPYLRWVDNTQRWQKQSVCTLEPFQAWPPSLASASRLTLPWRCEAGAGKAVEMAGVVISREFRIRPEHSEYMGSHPVMEEVPARKVYFF